MGAGVGSGNGAGAGADYRAGTGIGTGDTLVGVGTCAGTLTGLGAGTAPRQLSRTPNVWIFPDGGVVYKSGAPIKCHGAGNPGLGSV